MLQKLCTYNTWANSLVFEALTKASATQSIKIPDNCLLLLSHIANAQVIWTSRIQGNVPPVTVWQEHDLETCGVMLRQSAAQLKEIVEKDPSLDRIITYKTFSGDAFENVVLDILTHVFNHGTYHRAQIAKEMKNNGIRPVNTDYIQFVRQAPAPADATS